MDGSPSTFKWKARAGNCTSGVDRLLPAGGQDIQLGSRRGKAQGRRVADFNFPQVHPPFEQSWVVECDLTCRLPIIFCNRGYFVHPRHSLSPFSPTGDSGFLSLRTTEVRGCVFGPGYLLDSIPRSRERS